MKSGASGGIRPNDFAQGQNRRRAFSKVQAEIQFLLRLKGHRTLNGHPLFTDVDNLVEVERRLLRIEREARVRGSLNFVPYAPPSIRGRGFERRSYRYHGRLVQHHISAVCGKVLNELQK